VNVLIGNTRFWEAACEDWRGLRREWLKPNLEEVGFGPIAWLEPMRDASKMAGYLTKLAQELTGSNVKNQTPVSAPPHFRRLRSSNGTLPPIHTDPDTAGRLWQCPLETMEPNQIDVLTLQTVSDTMTPAVPRSPNGGVRETSLANSEAG
jgi:hypothetical protein